MSIRSAGNSPAKQPHTNAPAETWAVAGVAFLAIANVFYGCSGASRHEEVRVMPTEASATKDDLSSVAIDEGQRTFRFETFGDEEF